METTEHPTASLATFEAAAARMVVRLRGETARVASIRRLSGGASQETWLLRFTTDAFAPLILRRTPPLVTEKAGGLPIETEAALMRLARQGGVPSPEVLHVLAPEDGLGRGFLMAHVDGETIARKILRDEPFAATRPKLARQLGWILARIHALEPGAAQGLRVVTAEDELQHLRKTYLSDGQPRPVFEYAFRWLREHAPQEPPPKLVHGDFRLGNFIIGKEGVRAILDWELAHLGDPMRDLGWICTGSWRFGQIDHPVGGFGEVADLVAGYEAAGGGQVDPARLRYWEVFGSLRWGVMCLSMRSRFERGDQTIERAMIGRRASETEIDLLRLLLPRD